MKQVRRAILFVTDELFLPTRNGSSTIYAKVAESYARDGWDIYCISFYRNRQKAQSAEVRRAYRSLFSDFLLLPGWNGGGSISGLLGNGLRELSRWVTGNVFATGPLLAWSDRARLSAVRKFMCLHKVSTVYFHKPQAVMLLRDLAGELVTKHVMLDMHDDFVERAIQMRAAYDSLFASIGLGETVRAHLRFFLRHRLSRLSVERSRAAERKLLDLCDEVLIASCSEFELYRSNPALNCDVNHRPWPMTRQRSTVTPLQGMTFDAGFVGSDDIMNIDALCYFLEDVLPLIRAELPHFTFLAAGSVVHRVPARLRGSGGVTFWDRLDDVKSFYEAVQIVVAPLRYGTGVSVKVLEAVSFDKQVVSSSVGIRGITPDDLSRVQIANDPAEFASVMLHSGSVHRSRYAASAKTQLQAADFESAP